MFRKRRKEKKQEEAKDEQKQQETEAALLDACGEDPASLDKIQSLVDQYQDAVKAKNGDGERPLHIVCFQGASLDIVGCLYRAWPYGLRATSDRDWIPLHSACFGSGYMEMIQYLAMHYQDSFQALDNRGRLPLHLACFRGAPLDIVKYLVQGWPDSIKCKDNSGSLALHLACDNKAPLNEIKWLVEQWPDSLKQANNHGSLPLHRACFSGAPPEVIQYLIQQYPEACQQKSIDGDLPLHLACGSGAPLSVVQDLVETYPESVHSKDQEGKTPLDMAQQPFTFTNPSPEVIQYLQQLVGPQKNAKKQVDRWTSEPPPAKPVKAAPPHTKSMPELPQPPPPKDKAVPYAKERRRIQEVVNGDRNKPVSVPAKYVESVLVTDTILGKGIFGLVWKAHDPVIHQQFAVKRMDRKLLIGRSKREIEQSKEEFKREQKALLEYRHPNLALLYAYSISDKSKGDYHLLYQLAEKGSLDVFWISDLGRERLSNFSRRARIALNAFIGLRFLHLGNAQMKPIFHRDIKSANLVLQKDMTAQVIDVGLATFVSDSGGGTSMGVKGTRGYVCPKYCTGAIPYEAACDIFSFGVVLAELWTGQLQNYRTAGGMTFNFYEEYVDGEQSSMEDDLDKSLGFGVTADLPKYMRDFKDLALACMARNPNKRPSGDEVMTRLERIWQASKQAFFSDELSEDGSTIDNDEGSLNESLQLVSQVNDESVEEYTCRLCRTYANEVGSSECPMCRALEQERVRISKAVSDKLLASVVTKNSPHPPNSETHPPNHTTHKKHHSKHKKHHRKHGNHQPQMPLAALSDIRLNNQIARLFVLLPADFSMGWQPPKTWLRRHVATKYHLFFICGLTYQVIRPPIKLIASKVWVEKIAPVLGVSLTLLQMSAEQGAKICLHLGNSSTTMMNLSSEQMKGSSAEPSAASDTAEPSTASDISVGHAELDLNDDRLTGMLDEVKDILHNQDYNDTLDRISSGATLSDDDLEMLNGPAYELMVEKAREDRRWRSAMDPVRKHGEDSILWVAKSAAIDFTNEYEVFPT